MARKIALGSLAAVALFMAATAMAQQEGGKRKKPPPVKVQDPWAAEKADPDFADTDWGYTKDPPAVLLLQMAPRGEPLFQKYCVACHGEKGDGHGELAPMLIPPPRDFTKGIFKGRSTHPRMPPTGTDLMRSLVHGIPLSGMLSYSFISTEEQMALIGHVTQLAKEHFPKGYGFPLKTGNFHRDAGMPFPTPETIARGRALFDRFNCVACHGENGDGKGRVTDTLTDTRIDIAGETYERPSFVRDLTQGIYSGGPNVRHMYLRVSGGVQGTVMPPFAASASAEDRWALTHYVMSLSKRAKDLPLPHSEIFVVKKAEALPAGPGDPAWAAMDKMSLPAFEPQGPLGYGVQPYVVMKLYFQQTRHNPARPYFTEATARAMHDGKSIALLLEWEDPTPNPEDRIEVQTFKGSPPALTTFVPPGFVLYGSPADPVKLWRWESKTPADAAELTGTGPFGVTPVAKPTVKVQSKHDPVAKKWSVMFTRALDGDTPIVPGLLTPVSFLMKDGGEAWPEATRPIKADPEDSAEEIQKAKKREEIRKGYEAEVKDKFQSLPRHLTTWHLMRLEP